MKIIDFLRRNEWPSWAPYLAAILGVFVFLLQAVIYAHTTLTGLDESAYLFKGNLFLRGVYEPFEPYGPLTNKAPFAFLIPGFVQFLFGPGLRTGRYFAIFLGLSTVLGTWIAARRWAGNWIAAGTVWVFAFSPLIIKIYSAASSQVIIAAMLAWICVLVLGEERRLWQIILGSILASLAVLTRQNMVLVLPLLALYVFWQHGRQKGIWSLIAAASVFLAVHAYYWPNILTIWAPWLPDDMTPFLDAYRLPREAMPVWDPSVDLLNRTIAFFQGIRYHFIPAIGSLSAILLWNRQRNWKSTAAFRAAVFLALLYFILFALHAWAAVASEYESYSCVFCFTAYPAFFDPLGIILLAVAMSTSWNRQPSRAVQAAAISLLIMISIGIGLSLFENIGEPLLRIPVPRMREGQFLTGTTTLVELITNKFGIPLSLIKKYLGSVIGLLAGLGTGLLAFVVWRRGKKSQNLVGYAYIMVNLYLVAGLLLFPVLNAGSSRVDCEQDVITANEKLGAHLASVIPVNSLVYWDGGLSFTPMVYVPHARIFPPQINDGYAYRNGGDPDTLYRFGYWNSELNQEWLASADVFIIEEKRFSSWKDFLNSQDFEEYRKPSALPSCLEGAGLRIFHRLP